MRLEVGSVAVRELEFGSRTALHHHTLVVNSEEIRQLVLEDPHFQDVELDLARPGESIRIVHALDVVEPRWKVAGPGGVFPGFVAPPSSAGEGRTHRLAGVAVVEAGEPVPGELTHFREQVIDMAGPGARYSPFGQTLNLVLHFKPNLDCFPGSGASMKNAPNGQAVADYHRAITLAGLKVAAHLGRTAQDAPPDLLETFELAPCDPGLLKVVCLYQCLRPFLYGVPIGLPLGTVLHPNECFDGALAGWRQNRRSTYWDQNHEVLLQLCRHHGRDLSFLGCVLFGDVTPYRAEKERTAGAAAKLARLMGAQAAVLVGMNGSNYAIDLMWALQQCEQAGIKTTLITHDVGFGPDDPGLTFSVPEANAIVCTGSRDLSVTLPPVQKVIGGHHLIETGADAHGEITVLLRHLHSAVGVQGHNRLTARLE